MGITSRATSRRLLLCVSGLFLATALGTIPVGSADAATPVANEIAKLASGDAQAADEFGYSVAISGDTAVIGARSDDDNGSDSGSAYVFKRNGTGTWAQQQKLTASDGAASAYFGRSVAIDGDTVVIGAFQASHSGMTSNGAAYVFTRNAAGVWSQQQKLTASDAGNQDFFGWSVAIDADTAVIGARNENAAYVFIRDASGTWSQRQKLTFSDAQWEGYGGYSVAIDGDTVLVAAPHNSYSDYWSGAVYVFTRDSQGAWTEQQKLIGSDSNYQQEFGASVGIDGNAAVIGAWRDDAFGTYSGSAYLFTRDGSGTWTQQQKLTASDGAAGDNFGSSVAIDGLTVVIGARLDDDSGTDSGSAYVFKFDGSSWTETLKLRTFDPTPYDELGSREHGVDVEGTTYITGAYTAYAGQNAGPSFGPVSGAAYVFSQNSAPSCDAGGPYTAQCGLSVALDGSDSSDPDGDSVTYSWTGPFLPTPSSGATPTVVFGSPSGAKNASLTVSDKVSQASCSAVVQVQDTIAPFLEAPSDRTAECASPGGTVVALGTPIVGDECDSSPTIGNDAPAKFGLGATTVRWSAVDDDGHTSRDSQSVTVSDTVGPTAVCNSAASMTPRKSPASFTATAVDACSTARVVITDYSCFAINKLGKRISRADCKVAIAGDTITVYDAGGVSAQIVWSLRATDASGNASTRSCVLTVANPVK